MDISMMNIHIYFLVYKVLKVTTNAACIIACLFCQGATYSIPGMAYVEDKHTRPKVHMLPIFDGCYDKDSRSIAWNTEHEFKGRQIIQRTLLEVNSAEDADILYVPACLGRMVHSPLYARKEVEYKAVTALSKLNINLTLTPILIHRPHCHEGRKDLFPTLWNRESKLIRNVIFICVTIRKPVERACDKNILHVPYYVPRHRSVLPAQQRVRDFVYLGTCLEKLKKRQEVLKLLPSPYKICLHDKAHSPLSRDPIDIMLVRKIYARAKFVIVPPGNTPESRRIYEALASGTPIIYFDDIAVPLQSTFNDLAIPVHRADEQILKRDSIHDSPCIPPLLKNYSGFLNKFRKKRRKFLWNTSEFRTHLLLNLNEILRSAKACIKNM
jgi:glycosyltransferase involved in cell wall biosynthesis